MSLKTRALALLLAAGAAGPARADQVHFTGTTSVDAVVIRDALQNILRVAAARGCNQLSAVEARMLPPAYRPAAADDTAPGRGCATSAGSQPCAPRPCPS